MGHRVKKEDKDLFFTLPSALCTMRFELLGEMKHQSEGRLVSPGLYLRLSTHQLDQSGGDVKSSSPPLTV